MKKLLVIATLATAYFFAGKLGLKMAFVHASATAVWPPTGIALAAFLVLGFRVWPAIFLGAFLANITTAGTVATSIGIAAGNTLEGVAGAWLVNRFANGCNAFDRVRDVFRFALLAGIISTTVSATFGVTSLSLGGAAKWGDYGSIWLTWWLGDMGGALVMAPFLILWSMNPHLRWNWHQACEAVLLLLGLILAALVVFLGVFPYSYLCAPFFIWAAYRFTQREAATATVVLSGIAVWGTLRDLGPFVGKTQNDSLLLLQAFMCVMSVTSLAFTAVVSERERARAELRKAHDELELRVQERAAELRKSEEMFRSVAESAVDGIVSANSRGEIIFFNPSAERLFGYPEGEVMDRQLSILMPERFREAHHHGLKRFLSTGEAHVIGKTVELAGRRKDGTEFPIELSLTNWKVGEETFFTGIIRDITERKRAEETLALQTKELERSNSELRQFAYVASHDLQEPLRMVKSYTQLLAKRWEDRLDAEAGEFSGFVVEGVSRMQQLINDLLAYSQAGSGDRPLDLVNCETILDRTLENLEPVITESRAVVTRDPLPTLRADPVALSQLFQNLLANAIKFHGEQPPRIHVSVKKNETEWLFLVRDNGIGIEPQYFDRIFVIFQRLHNRSEYPGSGIGLAICKKIVMRHGGRIWVESKPGEGSIFHFTIPFKNAETA